MTSTRVLLAMDLFHFRSSKPTFIPRERSYRPDELGRPTAGPVDPTKRTGKRTSRVWGPSTATNIFWILNPTVGIFLYPPPKAHGMSSHVFVSQRTRTCLCEYTYNRLSDMQISSNFVLPRPTCVRTSRMRVRSKEAHGTTGIRGSSLHRTHVS